MSLAGYTVSQLMAFALTFFHANKYRSALAAIENAEEMHRALPITLRFTKEEREGRLWSHRVVDAEMMHTEYRQIDALRSRIIAHIRRGSEDHSDQSSPQEPNEGWVAWALGRLRHRDG